MKNLEITMRPTEMNEDSVDIYLSIGYRTKVNGKEYGGSFLIMKDSSEDTIRKALNLAIDMAFNVEQMEAEKDGEALR